MIILFPDSNVWLGCNDKHGFWTLPESFDCAIGCTDDIATEVIYQEHPGKRHAALNRIKKFATAWTVDPETLVQELCKHPAVHSPYFKPPLLDSRGIRVRHVAIDEMLAEYTEEQLLNQRAERVAKALKIRAQHREIATSYNSDISDDPKLINEIQTRGADVVALECLSTGLPWSGMLLDTILSAFKVPNTDDELVLAICRSFDRLPGLRFLYLHDMFNKFLQVTDRTNAQQIDASTWRDAQIALVSSPITILVTQERALLKTHACFFAGQPPIALHLNEVEEFLKTTCSACAAI